MGVDECRDKHNDLCASIERKVSLQLSAIDRAATLQATELDRRLDILNHHQAELKSFQDQFVRYDRYDDRMKIIDSWIDGAKRDITILVSDHEKRISTATWVAVFAVIMSAISIILRILI